ncbi:MAG: divergent PAP2 family protein [Bacillota bacterium]|nr:divergent PAP2 family protein [Bacillota bacterium]
MGGALAQLLSNPVLEVSFLAWFIAQSLKVVHTLVKEKRLNFRRFVGAGGMPSSHSAFVTSLATAIGQRTGWASPVTALAWVFAMIVMYDAAGVRQAAGKQAEILNQIVDDLYHGGRVREDRLKELLGHSPVEVLAGAALGVVIAALFTPR